VKIWIVEDNPADVYLIKEALFGAGLEFDAQFFYTGDAVVDRIHSFSEPPNEVPDAVILDLYLVKYSGTQLLERIRSHPSMADVTVIVLTSSNRPNDREYAEKSGANAYFHKCSDLDGFMLVGREIAAFITQDGSASAEV